MRKDLRAMVSAWDDVLYFACGSRCVFFVQHRCTDSGRLPRSQTGKGALICVQGWKMFAEAHRVQLGDHVSFELINETRLLTQVISARSPVLDRESPSRQAPLSFLRCTHSCPAASAVWADIVRLVGFTNPLPPQITEHQYSCLMFAQQY